MSAMKARSAILRYGLYGETPAAIPPQFAHVETISARSSLHDWTIAPHTHDGIFQILLIREGAATLAADGEDHALPVPCVVVMPCACAHAFRFAPETEGWVLSVADSLLGDPRIASLEVGAFAQASRAVRLPLEANGDTEAVMAGVMAGLASRLGGAATRLTPVAVAMIGLLLATVEECLASDGKGGAETSNVPADRRVDLVRRFSASVERHYREHLSVAEHALCLGATPQTLTRACRAVTGKAPGDMILDRLLLEAMRALTYTAAGVAQIAHDLGFADPAYFARFFKTRAGITASAFRRQRAWFQQGEREAG